MSILNLPEYIRHPERLDQDSLNHLRALVAAYPYHHAARLLYLRNLYQLHHCDFDRELRRAALFVPDRSALFQLIEQQKSVLLPQKKHRSLRAMEVEEEGGMDRTQSLLEDFLQTIPKESSRKIRPADATTDYMAYLLQTEGDVPEKKDIPRMQHQELIDDFIGQGDRRIILPATDTAVQPDSSPLPSDSSQDDENEDFFTETLAKIYIQQGRYEKAVEIIRRLSLKYPKKNRYFADQIRFLEKLIINSKNKK